jgi:hypothetical protein
MIGVVPGVRTVCALPKATFGTIDGVIDGPTVAALDGIADSVEHMTVRDRRA